MCVPGASRGRPRSPRYSRSTPGRCSPPGTAPRRPSAPPGAVVNTWNALRQALRGNGFDESVKTVWLAEGLLAYLTTDAIANLFAGTRACSGPGSSFLFSAPPPPTYSWPWVRHTTYETCGTTIRRAVDGGWALTGHIASIDLETRYAVAFPMDVVSLKN
eukprot:TRINITY_DN12773_c0_g1_i1.p2 TRINITY_DN12773_c0_g1~~TRINITY_DN12773_c0_g1_i1.p2  ORF type:complete len:160 (+),score=4.53 TRINITY_DN12773_c0_g1_i1:402-881(+)